MKAIFVIIIALSFFTGCSSYCNFNRVAADFDSIFIAQYKDGVKRTSANWHNIKEFVSEDIKTSGSRLGSTLEIMYSSVSIEGTSDRMNFYAKQLDHQFHDGIERTRDNFKTIAKYLCLCGD